MGYSQDEERRDEKIMAELTISHEEATASIDMARLKEAFLNLDPLTIRCMAYLFRIEENPDDLSDAELLSKMFMEKFVNVYMHKDNISFATTQQKDVERATRILAEYGDDSSPSQDLDKLEF